MPRFIPALYRLKMPRTIYGKKKSTYSREEWHLDNPLSPCKAAVGVAFPRPMKDFIAQVCQT